MNVAVLTTDTVHHCFFVDRLQRAVLLSGILAERRAPSPPFATEHPFEAARDEHERSAWFDGRAVHLDDVADAAGFVTLNEPEAVRHLAGLEPDVVVVFGTGKLEKEFLAVCPGGMVNLHGGDPERHRGLDSHLWAIHEGSFEALATTLHLVTARLDDGEIVERDMVPLRRGMALHELRRHNTELCLELTVRALRDFEARGAFRGRPQARRGRYFSFMPAELKERCRARFEAYTSTLP